MRITADSDDLAVRDLHDIGRGEFSTRTVERHCCDAADLRLIESFVFAGLRHGLRKLLDFRRQLNRSMCLLCGFRAIARK